MARWMLLSCIGWTLLLTGGCTQIIADKVLVPPRFAQRAERLNREGRKIEKDWGEHFRQFTYPSFDGTEILVGMFVPDCAPKATIVVLHGLTDQKEAMYPIAEAFARDGYLAVVPDLRAHGHSGGRYTSLGLREKRDQVKLLDYLAENGYDVSRSGVLGGSLGAAVAIQWAAIDSRIRAVIAVAPFAELRSEVNFLYRTRNIPGFLGSLAEAAAQKQGGFKIEDISPLAAMRTMRTPIYLAHGYCDKLIPMSESERLFEAANGPAVFQKAYCGHTDIRRALGDEFMRRAVNWMDTYVARGAGPVQSPAWVENYGCRNFATAAPIADSR